MTGAEGEPDAVIRNADDGDLEAIVGIYAHHLLTGLASFEEVPPDLAEIARRRDAVVALGLPYLVAEQAGVVSGFAYAGPFRTRPAYRHTIENSVFCLRTPWLPWLGNGRCVFCKPESVCGCCSRRGRAGTAWIGHVLRGICQTPR